VVEGMGIRAFGAVQNVNVSNNTGILTGGTVGKAPVAVYGTMRVSIALVKAGLTVGYIMNDGVNGAKFIILGVNATATQLQTYRFAFRNTPCKYDIFVLDPTENTVQVIDCDIEEIEASVGY
jgi:hypothetical protein